MAHPFLAIWFAAADDDAIGGTQQSGHPTRAHSAAIDDTALTARIRDGDRTAFDRLYTDQYPSLFAYAMQLTRDRDLAAEVVHDVFLAIWRRHTSWTVTTTVRSYLYAAVRNRAFNTRTLIARDNRIRDRALRDPTVTTGRIVAQDSDTEDADLIARVWREVEQLPPARREAVTLRWRHGLSSEEVARVMGISVAAARMQVSRALQTLRERMQDLFE